MRKVLLLTSLIFCITWSFAQDEPKEKSKREHQIGYFGIGMGMDYGGLGIKGELMATHWLGIFAGAGYNFVEPGVNAGISMRAASDKNISPVFLAMYGYNAAIRIKGLGFTSFDIHRKTYYGLTIGGGVEMKYGEKENKVSLNLLVPFRSADFHRDYKGFKDAGYEFKPGIIPVAFSIGCNFAFGKRHAR